MHLCSVVFQKIPRLVYRQSHPAGPGLSEEGSCLCGVINRVLQAG